MKRSIFTLFFAILASVFAFSAKSFVGFDAGSNLGTQIHDENLIQNQSNITLAETDVSSHKYNINLTDAGEGSFTMGGVTFALTGSAGQTAFKTYNTYIQSNGSSREVRIPTIAGERVKVVLTEACAGIAVNGESQDFVEGDNILTATGSSITLVNSSAKPKYQAILSLGTPAPSAQDLANAGYDVTNNVVVCLSFDVNPCNGVVYTGSFNNWSTDLNNCPAMTAVPNFNGWYAVEFSAENDEWGNPPSGKPIAIPNDGQFSWETQPGKSDAWEHIDGNEAQITNSGELESNVSYPSTGAYIYNIKYWKNHVDPCQTVDKYEFTFNFYAPYLCDTLTPAIAGTFNAWTPAAMTLTTDGESRPMYTITFEAAEGERFAIRTTNNYANYWLKQYNAWYGEWQDYPEVTLGSERTITLDCSDVTRYRMGDCKAPVLVTMLVPSDCGLDTTNGLWLNYRSSDDYGDGERIAMTSIGGHKFTASFTVSSNYYEVYVVNSETMTEGIQRSYNYNSDEQTICFEASPVESNNRFSLIQIDCSSMVDHNYMPHNLTATPLTRDSILFEWQMDDALNDTYFYIKCRDANNQQLFSTWSTTSDQRSMRVKAGTAAAVEVAYWTIEITSQETYITYKARGAGFTVQGDERLPHDINFTHDGGDLYTMTWEGGDDIHHYSLHISDYVHEDIETDVTTKSYQLNLADVTNINVTITAKDENDTELGVAETQRQIYTLKFYPPTLCDDIIPALSGTFNNWGTAVMTAATDENSKTYYGVKFLASNNDQYKIRGNDGTWNYALKQRNGDEWEIMEFDVPSWYTSITHDCSNISEYRIGNCLPPVLHAVTATVLVPTDCNMDTPNGLYIAWWANSNAGNVHVVPMTAGEGRKYSITFDPNDDAYGYYFCNNLDRDAEGYHQTESRNELSEASLCWEVGYNEYGGYWSSHALVPDGTCSAADHDYRPTGMQAVNSSQDTVLFSWNWLPGINNYQVLAYDADDHQLFQDYVYEYNHGDAHSHAFRNGDTLHIAYWKLVAVKRIETDGRQYYFYYPANGEGFSVAGDERIPHNLMLSEKSDGVYTLTWGGSDAVDHYRIDVNYDWEYQNYDTTALTYDLTLEDNKYYSITVSSMMSEYDVYGQASININTQKQEARDISLYFYLPESTGLMTEAGCAIVWYIPNLGGEHIIPLTADGDNGHWYKATVEQFTRQNFYFSFINAATKEAATTTLRYSESISEDKKFLIETNQKGEPVLSTSRAYDLYPHDYALTDLQATQVLNKMNLSWTANENAPSYNVRIYHPNGTVQWEREVDETSVVYDGLNNSDSITLTWSVTPRGGEWYTTFESLTLSGQFTAAPSPFLASDLRAVNNNDGTFTFSWSPAAHDTVKSYQLNVYDIEHETVANQYNIQDTTITLPVRLLFSGNYMMEVSSYDYRENYLGYIVDTFAIAPIAAHDIAIRVMVNPSCGLDATDSLQLRIKRYFDNDTIVNAVKERYGWWSYTVNTDQYGVIMNIKDYYEYARIYGDTCLEYNNRWREVDCEARAGDYIPHHLAAQPNADGTYAISWMMDMTERAKYYRVQVQHRDSNWNNDGGSRIESMQYTTSRLPYSGMYYYTVSAVEDGGNVIGQAVDSFTIAPMERDIVLRVLEQPLDENWSAYLLDIYGNEYVLNVEDEENPRWCRAVIHTTDPAVHIKLKSWYNSSTEFWMYGDTCIESNNGFHEIACDAVPENFTITNAHAVSQGNGYVSFTWNCLDNPDAFYIQTIIRDSVPLTYQYLEGSARSYTTLLNVDTVEQLTWYVMALKYRNDNYYRLTYVYGDTISIEPSAYAPKNLQYAPNSNGTYTITWNSNPDTVAQYLIQIKYPDRDDRDKFYTTDTFFITPAFPYLEAYDVYVYSLSKQNTNLGWQMVRIQVEELETPRDITIRVLLHPDAGRDNPGNLYTYNYSSRQWSGNTPTDEGGNWWSYTFSSTMPVQICYFPSLYVQDDYAYVAQDTCFEYVNELKYAACDAQPHDYRITANSFHAVSEPGKVTFTWSAAEKADEYRISADYSLHGEWRQLFSETVNDTSFVFLVPDQLDGAVLENAYVRPMAPHSLGNTSLDSTFILHKGQITLSELQATTTDSMTFNFTWQANTDTVYYQVAFVPYDDMNAEPTHVSPILSASNYSYTFLSAANRYRYWAVRATTAQGEPLTAWFPAENPIVLQPSLRAISNVQSTVVGDTITFTWNTTAPATGCRLSYSDINNYWYEIIARDSIVLDNTFTYIATQDGRYEISLTAYSEPIPGQYQSLNEYAYGTANYFSTPTYSVQVTTTTGGQFGWGDPSGDYPEGYHVWLDVYELEHYRFVGWSDGVMGNNRELIVSQDTFLIALFERRQEHTLTLYAGEGGLLHYYDPSMGEYNDTTQYQSVVEQGYGFYAEAVPSDGYAFYRWSDGYEYAGRSFDLRSDSTFTAYFLPLRYATVNAGEGGRVQVTGGEYNKSTRQYKLMEGESLILKALPDENYRFVNWSDGDVNVNRTLVVASDTVVTANFALITEPLAEYVVRILSGNTELGDVNNVSGTYHDGDQVTITALPKQNAMFTGWSDGVNEATRTITVTQDTTLTAAFDYKRFTLNISASDGGTVNDTTANGIYTYDEWVLITATPNEHYRFVEWSDGNTNASRYVNLVEDVTLTATFAVEQYLVTFLNADGAYIESNWWNYGETPVCSETPTLEPTEEYEYTFIGWTPEIVPVTGIAVYTATYEENPREPSGIDDLPVEPSDNVRKIFRNGQIFIIRGDRVYTVTGQLVK